MKSHFIERMTRHHEAKSCPKGLLEGWHQLEQAVAVADKQRQWQVIQWPTGTGKTEALTVLCATPEKARHPGALIVTKFTDEADKVARKINDIAGSTIALATHTKAPTSALAMAESPVLVITHEAYRSALREAYDRPDLPVRLDLYHRYFDSTRNWIIVDETLNWIDQYDVDLDETLAMCGALSAHMPNEVNLHRLSLFVHQLRDDQSAARADRLLSDDHFTMLAAIDFQRLRDAIADIPTETTELWRNAMLHLRTSGATTDDTELRPTSFKSEYRSLLSRLDTIKRIGRCWLSQRRTRTRLHSSRLLLNTERRCGVILDATASIDRTYGLLGDRVTVLPRPRNMRSYKNVRVHVSRPHHVGKEYLAKHAATEWPAIVERVSSKVSAKSKALIITHKSIKGLLRKRLACCEQDIGHWGDLDGKNEWRHSDTVLIFGLPYPDDIGPTDVFHACTGLWSADWFAGKRAYGGHADAKAAIKHGMIARSVIQAINRPRCRTIVDDQGNCAPTDVLILLPRGTVGDIVLAAIRAEMPGASIVPWTALPSKQPSITDNERMLLSELRGLASGDTYSKTQAIKQLDVTSRTFERMTVKIRDASSELARELGTIGVTFQCTIGRGKEAHFIKH